MSKRIFIGVAWPYANGPLHLGHVAGCYLPADIFARYHRMRGNDVLMVSGSDSHGAPITMRAEAEGITARAVVEKYHASFTDSWERLGITFDLFTTTMTENHREVVHSIFETLKERGYIYEDTSKVAYSPDFDRFLPDRYVTGTCPVCAFEEARGDQCDKCGSILDPVDLKDPAHVRSGKRYPIEIRDTPHLFFRLSAFNRQLLDWVRPQEHWRANVRNFTRGFLEKGLKDRAITRNLDWGLPVPQAGYEDKRIYVWFEAVCGYLSASIEWAKAQGDPDAWKPFWEDPDTRAYYFIGKDNIPFHTIIWPAMLMGRGGLNLPYDVPANEYLGIEGRKLSTSRNWAVWLPDYLDRFAPDPLRYCLTAGMPESSDADFSWAEYVRRNNDELVAAFGNLAHRTLTQVHRNFDAQVPEPGLLGPDDEALISAAHAALDATAASLEAARFREAIGHAMGLAREANRYLDAQAPWKQVKTDRQAAASTLHTTLHVLSALRAALHPFLPHATQRLHELLGGTGTAAAAGWGAPRPTPGTPLPEPTPLFTKLDDSIAEEMRAQLG
jgi:methionyl-tRNA synthetase